MAVDLAEELPAELRAVPLEMLEAFVTRRIKVFSRPFAQQLLMSADAGSEGGASLDALADATLRLMEQKQQQKAVAGRSLRFVHQCRFMGCTSPECTLCANNPNKRCAEDENFEECYADSQLLRAKCSAEIRVELVSASGQKLQSEQAVQLIVVDGEASCSNASHARPLFKSDEGKVLLGSSEAQICPGGWIMMQLKDGACVLPQISLNDKSDTFLVGGQSFHSFRLMARAVQQDIYGNVTIVDNIAPAVSSPLTIKTLRAMTDYHKPEYLHYKDKVTKLKFVGSTICARLKEVHKYVPGIPLDTIDTVEHFKQLVAMTEVNRQLEAKVVELLHMKGKHASKWDYLRRTVRERVVYDDALHRVWFSGDSRSQGLLFACKQGQVQMEKPLGVVQRVVVGGQAKLQVVTASDVQEQELFRCWKAVAEEAWTQPGHKGWTFLTEPLERALSHSTSSHSSGHAHAPSSWQQPGGGGASGESQSQSSSRMPLHTTSSGGGPPPQSLSPDQVWPQQAAYLADAGSGHVDSPKRSRQQMEPTWPQQPQQQQQQGGSNSNGAAFHYSGPVRSMERGVSATAASMLVAAGMGAINRSGPPLSRMLDDPAARNGSGSGALLGHLRLRTSAGASGPGPNSSQDVGGSPRSGLNLSMPTSISHNNSGNGAISLGGFGPSSMADLAPRTGSGFLMQRPSFAEHHPQHQHQQQAFTMGFSGDLSHSPSPCGTPTKRAGGAWGPFSSPNPVKLQSRLMAHLQRSSNLAPSRDPNEERASNELSMAMGRLQASSPNIAAAMAAAANGPFSNSALSHDTSRADSTKRQRRTSFGEHSPTEHRVSSQSFTTAGGVQLMHLHRCAGSDDSPTGLHHQNQLDRSPPQQLIFQQQNQQHSQQQNPHQLSKPDGVSMLLPLEELSPLDHFTHGTAGNTPVSTSAHDVAMGDAAALGEQHPLGHQSQGQQLSWGAPANPRGGASGAVAAAATAQGYEHDSDRFQQRMDDLLADDDEDFLMKMLNGSDAEFNDELLVDPFTIA